MTLNISEKEIKEFWIKNSYVRVSKKENIPESEIRQLSVALLQKKLYEKHGVRLSISFHSSLKRARDQKKIIDSLNKNYIDYPQLNSFYIEGSQNSSDKKAIIKSEVLHFPDLLPIPSKAYEENTNKNISIVRTNACIRDSICKIFAINACNICSLLCCCS